MLNPIATLLRYRNPFRFPIVVRRCAEGVTFEVRSPMRSASDCRSGREVTLFASDACLSISHRAPGGYYRDEIRITDMCRMDAAKPTHPSVSDGEFCRYIEPIGLFIRTAAQQERTLAKWSAERAAREAAAPKAAHAASPSAN